MNKQGFVAYVENNRKEIQRLRDQIASLESAKKSIEEGYAMEKAKALGYVPGKQVSLKRTFFKSETSHAVATTYVTAFFADAYPDRSGNIFLRFHPAKKDGTPSKLIDHNLTEYVEMKK